MQRLVGAYAKKREGDLVFVFEAVIRGGELRSSDESAAARFFSPDKLPDGLSERHRERIADGLSGQRQAFWRIQDSEGDEPPPGTR
jgi:hypothetical protein